MAAKVDVVHRLACLFVVEQAHLQGVYCFIEHFKYLFVPELLVRLDFTLLAGERRVVPRRATRPTEFAFVLLQCFPILVDLQSTCQ